MKKIVGIIGGMGPLATVDLMGKIILKTPAQKDQDHLHLITDSYAQIPDRTTAILKGGEDPTPYIVESAKRLEEAGADMLAIACNTAHYYYDAAQKAVDIPILHMPHETAKVLKAKNYKKVALLATTGTVETMLYQHSCACYSMTVITPNERLQQDVMNGIYAIKRNNLELGSTLLRAVAQELMKEGAEAIIAGCTEVPLVLMSSAEMIIIDPTEILAKIIINKAF